MPSVDELLNAAEVAVNELETNDIIVIDADTRTMIIPDTERIFGVMSDEKGERKYFRCNRFVGNGIDLSKLSLRIVFQNASGLDTGKDKYIVTDLAAYGEKYVTFSWELSRKVTAYKGIISFIVCAIKTKSDGTITNEWNTTLANGIVLEGLEANGTQEQEQVARDYYNQLEAELLRVANEQKTEIEKKAQEVIETIPSDYTQTQKDISNLKEDIVATQKAYLINPTIENDKYVRDDCAIIGYEGWDLLTISATNGDAVIVYSPVDSKYNAMYSEDNTLYKNVVLKNGMNCFVIPKGYRNLKISNEREIVKNVKSYILPIESINSNIEKLKKADKGNVLFKKIPYTYINNVDGNELTADSYSSSDFIELADCKKFVIECQEDSDLNALYDENHIFIQGIEYKKGITEFDKPSNAKYLRISCHTNFLETARVIFDSSISYRNFTHEDPVLPRKKGWESDRERIINEAYKKLLNIYKENPDIIPIFVCTDSHRWSPQHPQRFVNNIDTDGMKIANINLGDDVTECWEDLKFDTIYNNIRYIKNYIGVCGNHDKWGGTGRTEYFLRRIFTSQNAEYIRNSKRCCYSVTDGKHKVKYIVFDPYYAPNSGVPMVSIPTQVAKWVINELSKNDGYDIIFLNHQPLTDNNIHRDGTKQTWKMESYEEPIFNALFNVLKDRKNKRKGTYTDTDGIDNQYDFSQCENDLLCLLHGHSHEELYYIEDGLTSYVCDWDGAESTGYKSTFIAIDRSEDTLIVLIAKGSEYVEPVLKLKIN